MKDETSSKVKYILVKCKKNKTAYVKRNKTNNGSSTGPFKFPCTTSVRKLLILSKKIKIS